MEVIISEALHDAGMGDDSWGVMRGVLDVKYTRNHELVIPRIFRRQSLFSFVYLIQK